MTTNLPGELVSVGWQSTADFLPDSPRCVLATDIEATYIAVYANGVWYDAHSDEGIDFHITHWMELPELPEAY